MFLVEHEDAPSQQPPEFVAMGRPRSSILLGVVCPRAVTRKLKLTTSSCSKSSRDDLLQEDVVWRR